METRKMKLALSAGAIALSLALAGCGGGGSPQSPTQAELDAQEAMKRAEMQAEAIDTALDAARMAIGGIDAENPTQDQVTAAENAVEALDMAVKAAADVDADTVAGHAATVMDLNDSVTLAQSAVTTGKNLADTAAERAGLVARINALRMELGLDPSDDDLEGSIAGLQDEVTRLQGMVDKQEEEKRKAAAGASLKDAKALFAAAETDGGTTWAHTVPSATNWLFTPKYGGTTTISGPAGTPTSFDRKTKVEGKDTPLGKQGISEGMMVGKWSGTMVAADGATAADPSDTVVIYTNIEKDATKDFHVVHGDDPVTAEELMKDPKMVTGPDFGTGNVPKDHLKGAKVSGTFDGASGTYSCGAEANDCTSQIGAGDSGIQLEGAWTFTADVGATVMVPDADYAYFGWWLNEAADGTFSVHAFQSGAGGALTPVPVSADLSGTAKYMGPAVGKYAMVHDDGDGPSHTGGHFTAMADLTADFGANGVASSKVTGSIKKFVGGSDSMDAWEVKLDSSANNGAGSAVWHIGDNKGTNTGSFTRVFREADADDDPQTLTGQWQTRFDPQENTVTGHMIGAFGATKQ